MLRDKICNRKKNDNDSKVDVKRMIDDITRFYVYLSLKAITSLDYIK